MTSSHAGAIPAPGGDVGTPKTLHFGLVWALLRPSSVRPLRFPLLVPAIAVLLVSGCAGTRVSSVGRLANDERLVTLVVTEDRKRVDSECKGVPALGAVLGCHVARRVQLDEHAAIQTVKLVRFTDRLPSAMAFEIEAHELCHTVAGLQGLPDPCHDDNGGVLASTAGPALGLTLR